jgi:Glycosyl transferases group 1
VNVLLIAEYIRPMSWSTSAWVTHLAHALDSMGHRVRVVCDGIEDDAVMSDTRDRDPGLGIELIVRRPRRTLRGSDPLGFQRWALDRIGDAPGWLTWSFTRDVPARVWSPLGAPIVATLVRAVATHRPLSAAMEIAHRPWAAQALLAERRARRLHRHSSNQDEPNFVRLPPASRFDPMSSEDLRRLRDRTRDALGIPANAQVLVTSAVHMDRPGLLGMLRGFERARAAASPAPSLGADEPARHESARHESGAAHPAISASPGAPIDAASSKPTLLILGRKTHTIWKRCEQAGCLDGVRILGGTERVDAALAASDLALVYGSRPDPTSTGRFIADALRSGRPVVAQSGAAGSELLRSPDRSTPSAGIVVEDGTAAGWAASIGAGLSRGWRAIASVAAARVGADLSMERVIGRVIATGPANAPYPR